MDDAMSAAKSRDKRFHSSLPFALPHLFGMRMITFGVAFSLWPSYGDAKGVMGGVIAAWVAATFMAAVKLVSVPWKARFSAYRP